MKLLPPLEKGDIIMEGDSLRRSKSLHDEGIFYVLPLVKRRLAISPAGLTMTHGEVGRVFDKWNEPKLDSHLIEITRDIRRQSESPVGRTGGGQVDS